MLLSDFMKARERKFLIKLMKTTVSISPMSLWALAILNGILAEQKRQNPRIQFGKLDKTIKTEMFDLM